MPACFQLFPKGSDEPARFSEIDDAMCKHFGVEPDPDRYYRFWYDIEGFGLATGHSFDDMRTLDEEVPPEESRRAIIDWLDEHYTSDAWTEIGKR